jgi:hypothetical protein
METEPHIQPAINQPPPPVFNGFWPVLLIGLSVLLIFSWEIRLNIWTRTSARDLQQQQLLPVEQAKKVQTDLEKLVRGLVELAKTDNEAKKIVTKFGIKINNPALPPSAPSP